MISETYYKRIVALHFTLMSMNTEHNVTKTSKLAINVSKLAINVFFANLVLYTCNHVSQTI